MRKVVTYYLTASMRMKRFLWNRMHRIIRKRYSGDELVFLNYGFADLETNELPIKLNDLDEKERYCLQLYHTTVAEVDLKNKDILEIGCGRGGGASYITRTMKPKSYLGLDMSKEVIKFNKDYHKVENLDFVIGNAQELQFNDESFDAIVNVESSRSYNDIDAFISESYRVLRPGGHLLFADIRTEEENEELREKFKKAGFKVIKEENIIKNVVKALDIDSERRCDLIKQKTPKIMYGIAEEFSSIQGSKRYERFSNGTLIYMQYILQKE